MKHTIFAALIFIGACIAPVLTIASPEDMPLTIAVRSEIDRPFEGWGKAAIKEHGKAYMLGSISEARSEYKLVMPVDEEAFLDILRKELAKRGFYEVKNEKPDIILTVIYGRGYLKNPHLHGAHIDGSGMNMGMGAPTVNITMANIKYLHKRKEFGFEDKLQNANHEKLFIRVTAWANPTDLTPEKPGEKVKPKELWHTTMLTDDPANRDLNQFIQKLLAAGSSFFDREMDDEEKFITTDLPEGFIYYGEATVLEDE